MACSLPSRGTAIIRGAAKTAAGTFPFPRAAGCGRAKQITALRDPLPLIRSDLSSELGRQLEDNSEAVGAASVSRAIQIS